MAIMEGVNFGKEIESRGMIEELDMQTSDCPYKEKEKKDLWFKLRWSWNWLSGREKCFFNFTMKVKLIVSSNGCSNVMCIHFV